MQSGFTRYFLEPVQLQVTVFRFNSIKIPGTIKGARGISHPQAPFSKDIYGILELKQYRLLRFSLSFYLLFFITPFSSLPFQSYFSTLSI